MLYNLYRPIYDNLGLQKFLCRCAEYSSHKITKQKIYPNMITSYHSRAVVN